MTDETPRIRQALVQDAYALWLWANDPETRAASHSRQPIPWTAHVRWVNEQLASPNALILIAESGGGQPVGSTRFDSSDGWKSARLSYVVAPEARGRNISRTMLVEAIDFLRAQKRPGAIVADVMPDNERSLSVFRALGWQDIGPETGGDRRFQQLFVNGAQ